MLEKFVHNADGPDIFAQILNLRLEAAGAAHNKAYFHPGLAGAVKQPDHGFIGKTVEFYVDVRLFSGFGIAYFAFDGVGEKGAHALGGRHQLPARNRLVRGIEKIEDGAGVFRKSGIGGQKAHVAIQAGCVFVEVAGAYVDITCFFAALGALNKNDLAVHLEVFEAVDNAHPALMQHVDAFDVALFVKAGHELHAGRNPFAVLRCVYKGVDDARMVSRAVQGDGNIRHLGVDGRLAQKFHHMIESMVGEVQQNILAAHHLENTGKWFDVRMGEGGHDGVFQIWPHARKAHEAAHHVVARAGVKLAFFEVEL